MKIGHVFTQKAITDLVLYRLIYIYIYIYIYILVRVPNFLKFKPLPTPKKLLNQSVLFTLYKIVSMFGNPPPPPTLSPRLHGKAGICYFATKQKIYFPPFSFPITCFLPCGNNIYIFGSLKTFYENRMTRHFRDLRHIADIHLAKFRTRVMHVIGKINENIILFVCDVRV